MKKVYITPVLKNGNILGIADSDDRDQIIKHFGVENPKCPVFHEKRDDWYIIGFKEKTIEEAELLIKEVNESNRNKF